MQVSHRVCGEPGAPWLTLAHPIGSDKRVWDPVVGRLARHFRVLAYDVRGHGDSPPVAGAATFDALAAECEALWDALGIDRSHFVGLSLGGCIGVALASRVPARVASLTVACSRLGMDDGAAGMWRERARLVEASGMAAVADATLGRWLTPEWRAAHPDEVEAVRAALLATDPAGFAQCARALAQGQPQARLAALSVPVLYVAGRDDAAVPSEHLRRYHAQTPGARWLELAGPHLLHIENPDGFADAVIGFAAAPPA